MIICMIRDHIKITLKIDLNIVKLLDKVFSEIYIKLLSIYSINKTSLK